MGESRRPERLSAWRNGCAALAIAALAGCGSSSTPDAKACAQQLHWVSAWQAPPTDSLMPVDDGFEPILTAGNQTFRAILSPLGAGTTARLRLSNRFGLAPMTFNAVTIARRTSGASIDAASLAPLRFGGAASVTIPAGGDVTSDPVAFTFKDFDDVAVSVNTADAGLFQTHHYLARQTSYATLPLAGNHVDDPSGDAFVQSTTMRPFVVGLETLGDAGVGAIVTVGDSLTDGQGSGFPGMPEDPSALDQNLRYPDFLRRRLIAAQRPVFVSNAGISGNRVLLDGPVPSSGPSLLSRLDLDVIGQAGVTDVLLWEGINDLNTTPGLSVEALAAGYTEAIDRLHAAGIRVIHATLTPGGPLNIVAAGTRQGINEWIRAHSPADAIVDFDAAVRDPENPGQLFAEYDAGDGLHMTPAGYQRLADEIDLREIAGSTCK